MKSPASYARPCILALKPYSTARDEFDGSCGIDTWVDANESPYTDTGLNRYPDPHHLPVKRIIADMKGVTADMVFIAGSGSDEAIDLVFRVFCEPRVDNVVTMSPTYGVYSVAAAINDVECREVPLGEDFAFSSDAMLAAADSHTKVMWICSPNNPTGGAVAHADIERLLSEFDGIVVVDEAYVDFAPEGSALPLMAKYPNLIVLQTLSKARGMASLRIGMAFAHPSVAALMANVKYPYNVNGPTLRALPDLLAADISDKVAETIAQRKRMEAALAYIDKVERVYHSDANFLLVKVDDADALYSFLMGRGILARNRNRVPGCAGCLRITIGTPDENDKIIKALQEYDKL